MMHVTDAMVAEVLTAESTQAVLREAFLSFEQNQAANLPRLRAQAGGVRLSSMGAVALAQGVVGAKVYPTIGGVSSFVILLFSAHDGRPLATFDAGVITRLRTTACSVLAAQVLARKSVHTLGLFGAGTQGLEHAVQMARAFPVNTVLIWQDRASDERVARLAQATGLPVVRASAQEIASQADIVVTATRSATPVLPGQALRPGAFVAAVGSSQPTTRELDDDVMARAKAVVVEWQEPALTNETGDLALVDPALNVRDKLVELGRVLAGGLVRSHDDDIFVYKGVGVGLEDVAVAGYVYQQLVGRQSVKA